MKSVIKESRFGRFLKRFGFYKTRLNVFTLIEFKGFFLGFHWVHANGDSSYTSAVIASYHNPKKAMWKWALYWQSYKRFYPIIKYGGIGIPFIGIFYLSTQKVTC